jgi:hypothetical protein
MQGCGGKQGTGWPWLLVCIMRLQLAPGENWKDEHIDGNFGMDRVGGVS